MRDSSITSDRLRSLNTKKAPGSDGIPNEFLRALPRELTEVIRKLFLVMWCTACTPTEWKHSDTKLLYKENGKYTNIAKGYRPIGLASSVYKLWTRMVACALYRHAATHSILSGTQNGFRQGFNAQRSIQHLVMLLEDARLSGNNMYLLNVDFSSAFNMIDHDVLLCILYDLGFPTDAVNVVRDL
jgi:Reverse transcriptase (RNA-dependent DNA polymerase)